jgi:hypothetical protein
MMMGTRADCERYAKWPKEDLQANMAFMRAFSRELKDSDAFVSSEGLAFPDQAKLVRAGSDGLPITDGIFPEAKEFLMGYLDRRRGKPRTGLSDRRAGVFGARPRWSPRDNAHRGAPGDERSPESTAVTGGPPDIPIERLLRDLTRWCSGA